MRATHLFRQNKCSCLATVINVDPASVANNPEIPPTTPNIVSFVISIDNIDNASLFCKPDIHVSNDDIKFIIDFSS